MPLLMVLALKNLKRNVKHVDSICCIVDRSWV